MILLRWRSMEPIRKVPLESMSLELSERESTASITPADMTGISLDSWLQDETEPGKGIVWRVRNIRNDYTNDTPEVELEHVVNSLKDDLLFGEITPAVITGDAKATVCTARQAVEYILSKQTSKDWVLGTFDYGNVSNAYKFDGDSLFDALEEVTKTLEGARWSYGLGGYPFKLNITQKTDTVESELRPARNLQTITKTVDKSGMYTRIYPIGYDDLHLSGAGYIERNVNLYGLVSHTETDTSRKTEAELRAWAETRLAVHCEPKVTIEVDGLELAEATGVPLDKLWLGFRCRIPLWEFGTEITERIESLSYPDMMNQPEVVQITLANESGAGLLVIGRDPVLFQELQKDPEYLRIDLPRQQTVGNRNNVMGAGCVKAGSKFPLYHSDRILRLVSVAERFFHPDDSLHRRLRKAADPDKRVSHQFFFKCKLSLIPELLKAAASAAPRLRAGSLHPVR